MQTKNLGDISILKHMMESDTKIMFLNFLAVTCASLSLENGEIEYNASLLNGRYPVYTMASFSCNQFYNRTGSSSTICQIYGNWSQQTPTCSASNEQIIQDFYFLYFAYNFNIN